MGLRARTKQHSEATFFIECERPPRRNYAASEARLEWFSAPESAAVASLDSLSKNLTQRSRHAPCGGCKLMS